MNAYEAWLRMKHIDDPNSDKCKSCKMPFEEFSARIISCTEYREEQEIALKKLQDDLEQQRY